MTDIDAREDTESKERGLLGYIGLGLSWGLLALVSLVAVLVVLLPAVTGSTPYTIITSSMEPSYPAGTLVIVRPVEPDDVRIGSVITYQLESGKAEVVTHRVVEIIQPSVPGEEPRFVTKGDANGVPDEEPVMEVQLRGEVWYSVPWIGWVNNVVNGDMRAVIIPIVAGVLFLYAGYQVVSAVVQRRRERAPSSAGTGASAGA
ncbi:signal peptidase I [Demequina sp. NBRC 110053]|uniref:signal peptidase I n=1 Tax=Demequina sp. NBRC 110053 TaxID=1570342 RepID=UPI000A009B55|nr:signal peptidase I [Demequina sp. NBRC 110053]